MKKLFVVNFKGTSYAFLGLSWGTFKQNLRQSGGAIDNIHPTEGYISKLKRECELKGCEESFKGLQWLSLFMLAEYAPSRTNQSNFNKLSGNKERVTTSRFHSGYSKKNDLMTLTRDVLPTEITGEYPKK